VLKNSAAGSEGCGAGVWHSSAQVTGIACGLGMSLASFRNNWAQRFAVFLTVLQRSRVGQQKYDDCR
jgi:hypothetical protein